LLGERCYPDLESVPEAVDIVDIFRRSEFVPEIVEAAIRKGAKVIWMQEGVVHEEAARRAQAAGPGSDHGPLHPERPSSPGVRQVGPASWPVDGVCTYSSFVKTNG
jgi:hypothetical protein